MNEPLGNRLRVALTGLTIAESSPRRRPRRALLRGQHLPLHAGRHGKCPRCWSRMPSAVGYQPTLAEEMGRLQERITSTKVGSITSIQAVYVPADDYTDPSPGRPPSRHLDSTRGRCRVDIASLGIYPAIDPLDSTSRARSTPTWSRPGALRRRRVPCSRRAAALQGIARHHRDPGHGRAFARGQTGRRPRAQDPALPLAAVPRGRGVHGHAGQVRAAGAKPFAASR